MHKSFYKNIFRKIRVSIGLFVFESCAIGCNLSQNGGTNLTAPSPSCADCSGGTIKVSLTGGSTVNFDFTPSCSSPSDYVICSVSIFNSRIAAPEYPLIYSGMYSYTCSAYDTITVNNIACRIPCANSNDKCIWITVVCNNTSKGNVLKIDHMPDNVTCI